MQMSVSEMSHEITGNNLIGTLQCFWLMSSFYMNLLYGAEKRKQQLKWLLG